MINRQNPPTVLNPELINIPKPVIHYLPGNIPVIVVNEGTQEVMKVELVFAAGTITENIPMLAFSVNELIDEGTKSHNSAQIAEAFDNYGAYLQTECGSDFSTVTLFTLSKFLSETLPLLVEIITEPSYAEKEINTFCTQGKQRLEVNLEKVDFLARRHFIKAMYGEKHPYGHFPSTEDYNILNTSLLKDFHQKNYLEGLNAVVIAGKFSDEQLNKVIESLEPLFSKRGLISTVEIQTYNSEKIKIVKDDAVQSAIRIGRKMFSRNHPDYFKFSILNTVLGGYFGSRLMSNIREDKGYTYGIGSGIIPLIQDGYFFISTEVGADVCVDAVKEIYYEIDRLRTEVIPDNELELVKNYLFGSFQRSIDGPFSVSERHKTLIINNLSANYFELYMDSLFKTSSDDLLEIAKKHLDNSEMTEVITGP